MRTAAVSVLALLAVATSGAAARADTFALASVTPAPAGDRFFVVQSADTAGHGTFAAGLTSDFGIRPLVLTPTSGGDSIALVGLMAQHHMGISLGLGGRVKLGFQLPIATVSGEDIPGFDAPSGTSAGDLGASLRVVVLGGRTRPYRLSIGARAFFPTGDDDLYLSDGSVRGGPDLMVSGRAGFVVWAVNAGMQFREQSDLADVTIDDQLTWGIGVAGLGLRGRFQLGVEILGSHVMAGDDKFSGGTTNLEALLGARFRIGPAVVGPALGPGISNGLGTPSFRVLLGIAFAPQPRRIDQPPPPDDDRWRPPPPPPVDPPQGVVDSDGDGIMDPDDACPRVPGVESQSASERGCPIPDRDGDGIPDSTDACPYSPGPPLPDPRRTGCPSDRDFDGVLDPDDACPDVKGALSADTSKNGCPRPPEPAPSQ